MERGRVIYVRDLYIPPFSILIVLSHICFIYYYICSKLERTENQIGANKLKKTEKTNISSQQAKKLLNFQVSCRGKENGCRQEKNARKELTLRKQLAGTDIFCYLLAIEMTYTQCRLTKTYGQILGFV